MIDFLRARVQIELTGGEKNVKRYNNNNNNNNKTMQNMVRKHLWR